MLIWVPLTTLQWALNAADFPLVNVGENRTIKRSIKSFALPKQRSTIYSIANYSDTYTPTGLHMVKKQDFIFNCSILLVFFFPNCNFGQQNYHKLFLLLDQSCFSEYTFSRSCAHYWSWFICCLRGEKVGTIYFFSVTAMATGHCLFTMLLNVWTLQALNFINHLFIACHGNKQMGK